MKITTIYEFDIVWCLSSLGVQHGCGTFDFFAQIGGFFEQ